MDPITGRRLCRILPAVGGGCAIYGQTVEAPDDPPWNLGFAWTVWLCAIDVKDGDGVFEVP